MKRRNMKKLNKILFGFGSIAAVAAPVAAVVACDDKKDETTTTKPGNQNGTSADCSTQAAATNTMAQH